jgi:hypothetical protein
MSPFDSPLKIDSISHNEVYIFKHPKSKPKIKIESNKFLL